eukprot:gene10854-biopygen15367
MDAGPRHGTRHGTHHGRAPGRAPWSSGCWPWSSGSWPWSSGSWPWIAMILFTDLLPPQNPMTPLLWEQGRAPIHQVYGAETNAGRTRTARTGRGPGARGVRFLRNGALAPVALVVGGVAGPRPRDPHEHGFAGAGLVASEEMRAAGVPRPVSAHWLAPAKPRRGSVERPGPRCPCGEKRSGRGPHDSSLREKIMRAGRRARAAPFPPECLAAQQGPPAPGAAAGAAAVAARAAATAAAAVTQIPHAATWQQPAQWH